ncbi:SAG-related sequence [Besnoitia besnoiti]|uniref:SAG-related sequence n=1 Tax=Besnoitia besnoiti TaxID=94643 RepID=A0A2A9MGV6_BESBE|nr:SAG-related sequence [Besnoitia besnoiti]PFH37758.1 SAG-related sequence [Besnoitia besnoiti]
MRLNCVSVSDVFPSFAHSVCRPCQHGLRKYRVKAKMVGRSEALRLHVRKFVAVCAAGVLLLSGEQVAEGQLPSVHLSQTPQADSENAVLECRFPPPDGAAGTPGSTTLSETQLSAALQCTGDAIELVPASEKNVCVAHDSSASLSQCKSSSTETLKQVELQLLLGSDTPIQVSHSMPSRTTQKTWKVELKRPQLPRSDKAFFVGCVNDQSDTTSNCKLTVNVEARKSAVNNNVATCAYGQKSNPQPLKVEMTGEANTVTIDCGDDGTFAPGSYMTEYCVDDGKSLRECEKKAYADVFPGFEQSWWKAEESTKQAPTLTIPASGFPSEDQQLLLGCVPTRKAIASRAAGAPGSQALGEADAANTGEETSCKVLVTVKAAASSSNSPSFALARPFPLALIVLVGLCLAFTR